MKRRTVLTVVGVVIAAGAVWKSSAVDPAPKSLASLEVAPDLTTGGYKRDLFPHWEIRDGACDTREIVLREQGTDVARDAQCRAIAGRWVSPYDGVVITDAGKVDIDHVVPLAEAWRSGAAKWSPQRRTGFANDLTGDQLVAATAASNRAKGDQDPAHWRPARRDYWCTYATNWVSVKSRYRLTADQAEHAALAEMLATC